MPQQDENVKSALDIEIVKKHEPSVNSIPKSHTLKHEPSVNPITKSHDITHFTDIATDLGYIKLKN